jgi:hypothetical protein
MPIVDSVHTMNQNLENRIVSRNRPNFKSEGERRIAHFLEDNSIKYQYEPGVLVNSFENKPRIWYTDFYLPELKAYIEYYGLVGRKDYDRGIKTKESMYSKMGMEVIPIFPWTFAENWEDYIMNRLKQSTIQSYKNLMAKPYWSQNRRASSTRSNASLRKYPHRSFKRY